jgi:DNA-binding NtrC family response regulator
MPGNSVLVVDDDPVARASLALVLRRAGHAVRAVSDGLEALLSIEARRPDVVVTDLRMPHVDGLELLRRIEARWAGLPVVVLTVSQDFADVKEAIRLGAIDYLLKPSAPEVVLTVVARWIAARSREASTALEHALVGMSPGMMRVREQVALAARSSANVLVVGETGTGKELVARAIHASLPHPTRPFVAHNCAATPGDLFEAQFFGYCRGAFTGADRDTPGLLELASGGLLFLDEIECMPPAHQAKLLRVFDDGEFRPVGSSRARRAEIRVIGALNRDPAEIVAEGTLRRDFYYRLRGMEIRLPPLAARKEDIPLLAERFLAPPAQLAPQTLAALVGFGWPGNVRELRNALCVAAERAGPGLILPEHLDLDEPRCAEFSRAAAAGSLRELEARRIREALFECDGNRSRAARMLGIDRSTLQRKLAKLPE